MAKQLTTKKLDIFISHVYSLKCHGPIDIFDIGKVYAAGRDAFKANGSLDDCASAVIAAFERFKAQPAESCGHHFPAACPSTCMIKGDRRSREQLTQDASKVQG